MDGTSLQVSKGPIAVWIGLYQTENGLDWTWMDGEPTGTNCIKIGLSGKLILSKRKGLLEELFS